MFKIATQKQKAYENKALEDNMNTYEEKFMFAPYHLNKKTFQV